MLSIEPGLTRGSLLTGGRGRGDRDRSSRLTCTNGDCLRRSRPDVGSARRPRDCPDDDRCVDDLLDGICRSSRAACLLSITR